MIPYFGTHVSRQRINNKPIRVGYKFWVLGKGYGYVIQFKTYQGAKVGKQIAAQTRWGLGEKFVLDLTECLPEWVSYHIHMDNCFTPFHLLAHLGEHTWDKQLQKKTRVYTEEKTYLPKKSRLLDRMMIVLSAQLPIVFHQIQLNQFVDGTKLKESTFKSTNQTSVIVITKIWVLWIEWFKMQLSIESEYQWKNCDGLLFFGWLMLPYKMHGYYTELIRRILTRPIHFWLFLEK